ncbi:hypothetical protein AU468_13605 [Alkalispirochaeta sphaeroplastigenens]|uniref:Toxin-antitoxin system antitoxin subunit n=1 Tax=Alkalispirochaeta sphaeroplastigenens TaxID=1187066 RepID=A0A2S4JFU8_9SPIO|nr:hypothetical protein AU468_13605 [Alkalispirochaeta sphaeroplastigenens]
MNATLKATLESALVENDGHSAIIQENRNLLLPLFPLTLDKLENLQKTDMAYVDQLLYRFLKMQDSLGTRLIPGLYSFLEADDNPRPFLDRLRRMEKLGVLTSEEDWQLFRELRNNLAHEYPDSKDQTVENLNQLFQEMPRFLDLYTVLKEQTRARLDQD